jgi:hypothetical protein
MKNNICEKCGKEKELVKLNIVDCDCWNCKKPMKVALAICGGTFWGPEEFDEETINLARKNGAIIENRFSNMMKESYLANVCPSCNQIVGKFFIHDYLYDDKSLFIDAGHKCLSCAEVSIF